MVYDMKQLLELSPVSDKAGEKGKSLVQSESTPGSRQGP